MGARAQEASRTFRNVFVVTHNSSASGTAAAAIPPVVMVCQFPGPPVPRAALQFMVTATRSLVAATQMPREVDATAALRGHEGIVDAVARMLTACALPGAPVTGATVEGAQATAAGVLAAAGGSLADLVATHPQDIVDAVGLDADAAHRFAQGVHMPGPAALALSWP